jgi:branched-chain amino acid transport system ATP-binding protein
VDGEGLTVLRCNDVTKTYGGLAALDGVTFSVERGEVFAIVGPNGAGKTTLFDTISGLAPATSGTITLEDVEIQRMAPHRICQLGLARLFQTSVSFSSQTVFTNVLVGSTFGREKGTRFRLRYPQESIDAALQALDVCDLYSKQELLAKDLPVIDLKRLMFASALATGAQVLLLDEPFAGLNREERDELIELVRKINGTGVTVVMIEHIMKAVQALADRMLVLHHGQPIVEGRPAEVLSDPRVAEVYLGKSWSTKEDADAPGI